MRNYYWPLGIVTAMLLFMGMTLMFVKKAFSERVDLVAPDYYYRDKVFSERLTQENALAKLGKAEVTRSGQGVKIFLPAHFTGKRVKGSVQFYSPLNPADDFNVPLEFAGTTHEFKRPVDKTHMWKVSFTFESDGKKYYLQSTVQ
jgi:hypothetical protein